jgi:hypothetical protein
MAKKMLAEHAPARTDIDRAGHAKKKLKRKSKQNVRSVDSIQGAIMGTIKKSAKEVMTRGRDAAVRVGSVAKAAAVAGAKAGATAAMAAGALEAEKSWKETSPAAAKKRTRNNVAAVLAGAAVLGAAGVMIARSRRKK